MRAVAAPAAAYVGGEAASFADQQTSIGGSLPLALLILAGGTLIVLWLMTGSVVLPVKTLVMNTLTAAATTGVLVLVFQDGRFTDLLGFTSEGGHRDRGLPRADGARLRPDDGLRRAACSHGSSRATAAG